MSTKTQLREIYTKKKIKTLLSVSPSLFWLVLELKKFWTLNFAVIQMFLEYNRIEDLSPPVQNNNETMWGRIYQQTYCLLYSNIWNNVQKNMKQTCLLEVWKHYVTWMRWTLKTCMDYREEGWVKGGNSDRFLE